MNDALDGFLTENEERAMADEFDSSEYATPKMRRLHSKLIGWFENERRLQAVNRYQMSLDEDFYDSLQWSDEDAQKLMDRGQAPLVYNLIKPAVNWILGTERRTRVDYRVRPREADDVEGAVVKTKLLKYLSDCNNTSFHRSAAFKESVIAGVSYLEDTVSTEPGTELIYSGYESWRNCWDDSQSRDVTGRDRRYFFRAKYIDIDIAEAIFGESNGLLQRALMTEDEIIQDRDEYYLGTHNAIEQDQPRLNPYTTYNSAAGVSEAIERERVKIIECWYRVPVVEQLVRVKGKTEVFNPAVHEGMMTFQGPVMRMRVCLMTEEGILWEGESPFKHNDFPFTPIWCYRRARDGAPYGVVRDLRSAQEDYNKRMSKALHILASRQAIIENGATDDVEELREELASPDGLLEVDRIDKIKIIENQPIIRDQIAFAQIDETHISKASGVVDELMGRATNAVSGEAIKSRQLQGSVVTALIFDNYRLAFQLQGEKQLSLAEQYMVEQQTIRIAGARRDQFVTINEPLQMQDGSVRVLNDITARKADFVVDAQDYQVSVRQALFNSMMELLSKFPPEVGMRLLPMVMDMVDLPNKDEMVAEVRRALGQPDPNAEMTPEEQQAAQQQAQIQQAVQQLQFEAATLANEKVKAEVAKLNAQAQAEMQKLNEQPGNQESDALRQQLAQLQQQSVQVQQNLQAQIERLKNEAIARRDEVELKYASQTDADERKAELERERMDREDQRLLRTLQAERDAKIEVAKIQAEAQLAMTDANGAADKILSKIGDQIKALSERIDAVGKEAKDRHDRTDQARKAEEKGWKEGMQTAPSAAPAPAPAAVELPPITVNIEAHIDAKTPARKVEVTRKADGSGFDISSKEEPKK